MAKKGKSKKQEEIFEKSLSGRTIPGPDGGTGGMFPTVDPKDRNYQLELYHQGNQLEEYRLKLLKITAKRVKEQGLQKILNEAKKGEDFVSSPRYLDYKVVIQSVPEISGAHIYKRKYGNAETREQIVAYECPQHSGIIVGDPYQHLEDTFGCNVCGYKKPMKKDKTKNIKRK